MEHGHCGGSRRASGPQTLQGPGTFPRPTPTQLNRPRDIPGTLKKPFTPVHPVHPGNSRRHPGPPNAKPPHTVPTNHTQPTKAAGTRTKGPKSLPKAPPQKSGHSGEKLGQLVVGTTLEHGHRDGPRRARASNYAGTPARPTPTPPNRPWDTSGTLKKLFTPAHSVHPGNLRRHFGLPNVRSSSHCPYQSYSTNKSRRNTKLNLKTTVPKLSQFCPNVPILFQKSGFINSLRALHLCDLQLRNSYQKKRLIVQKSHNFIVHESIFTKCFNLFLSKFQSNVLF